MRYSSILAAIGLAAPTTLFSGCNTDDYPPILDDLYPGAVPMRLDAIDILGGNEITPDMFNSVLEQFGQDEAGKEDNIAYKVERIEPFLPLFNAIYQEATGHKVPKKLLHSFFPEENEYDVCDFSNGCKGAYNTTLKTVFQTEAQNIVYLLWNLFHETGHAHDHLVWGRVNNEFTSEFLSFYSAVLSEKHLPPITALDEITYEI